jgi:hypothetical protein
LKEFDFYIPNDFDEAKAFTVRRAIGDSAKSRSSPYLSPMSCCVKSHGGGSRVRSPGWRGWPGGFSSVIQANRRNVA